jgi:hypothetical protein
MTDPNRQTNPADWDELVKAAVARELDARSRRGRSAMRTAAVATFAFGLGALAATVVLTIQEKPSKGPVLASESLAPDPVETPTKPLLRNVVVQPNVAPSSLPQDSDRYAEEVGPALDARQADERAAPEAAQEPWATDRQNARVAARPDVQPRGEVPAEVPAPAEAAPLSSDPPALVAAPSESVAAPALARVRSAVSMRAGPDRRSEVVGTVPADGPVQVVSCDGWCEVVYNGRRGFIYQTFLDGAF